VNPVVLRLAPPIVQFDLPEDSPSKKQTHWLEARSQDTERVLVISCSHTIKGIRFSPVLNVSEHFPICKLRLG
jgi:hypothetical protein